MAKKQSSESRIEYEVIELPSLQERRKEAGFDKGSELARELGISTSSLSRYEADGRTIPIDRAWQMADLLHCTIDEIFGRTEAVSSLQKSPEQRIIDRLSPKSLDDLRSYLAYLEYRDKQEERQRKASEASGYMKLAEAYEQEFLEHLKEVDEYDHPVMFDGPLEYRSEFLKYLQDRAEKKRRHAAEQARDDVEFAFGDGMVAYIPVEGTGAMRALYFDEPEYHEHAEESAQAAYDEKYAELEEKHAQVIEKVMAAFDEMHPEAKAALDYQTSVEQGRAKVAELMKEVGDLKIPKL